MAVEAAGELRESQIVDLDFPRLDAVNTLALSALYDDGDGAVGRRALGTLTESAFGLDGLPRADARLEDLCTVSQWRAWHGDPRGVEAAIRRLRTADSRARLKDTGPVCAVLLDAIRSTLGASPNAASRVARLDSILATGPHAIPTLVVPANLAVARLHERLGDSERALAAVRRRMYDFDGSNLFLATSLRLEGRLAAEVGDREGAINAYRHYLALRTEPEPALQAQADTVAAALAALERQSRP